MRIGFACPVPFERLKGYVRDGNNLPATFSFNPAGEWVVELLNRGHHVTVYTTGFNMAGPQTFSGEQLTIRIAAQRSRGTGRDFFAPERRQLRDLMKEDALPVIHAHWTYEFALAALDTKLPTLITVHDLPWNVLRYFRDPYRIVRLLMAYEVAARGRNFTAVSEDAARHWKHYMRPGARVDVVPNGLPDAFFERNAQDLRLTGDVITFATVLQGWSTRKNASVALEAFAKVREVVGNARLLMFGDDYGPGQDAEHWARERNLAGGVEFIGLKPYPELMDLLARQVDVLVHPSLDESFSMAALEGMALHKPVIAGKRTPGVREVLDFGRAGVLVDVRSPDAVRDAMLQLAQHPEYRKDLADKGFARATKNYRTSVVMSRYQELYEEVARMGRA
jgi:glycosyltransferase involved in cell wall biosynthesis